MLVSKLIRPKLESAILMLKRHPSGWAVFLLAQIIRVRAESFTTPIIFAEQSILPL
jgi:hypothetical protein